MTTAAPTPVPRTRLGGKPGARPYTTRSLLDRYGIRHVHNESGGGHTWINWRRYLADFAPRLFE